MAVLRVGDGLILMSEQARFRRLCEAIGSALEGARRHRGRSPGQPA